MTDRKIIKAENAQGNARFDLPRWERVFNDSFFRKEAEWLLDFHRKHEARRGLSAPSGEGLLQDWVNQRRESGDWTSPRGCVARLRLRQNFEDPASLGRTIPTDLIVWQPGEPPSRWNTKIGGIPYWPATKRWPKRGDKPLQFVAQICFTDSLDFLPELPGDLLALFVDEGGLGFSRSPGKMFTPFWFHVGAEPPLEADNIPAGGIAPLLPYHGEIFRTMDYPDCLAPFMIDDDEDDEEEEDEEEDEEEEDEASSDDQKSDHLYYRVQRIGIVEGAKIGGAPHWIQYDVLEDDQSPEERIASGHWMRSVKNLLGGIVGSKRRAKNARFLFCLDCPSSQPSSWGAPMSEDEYWGRAVDREKMLDDGDSGLYNFVYYEDRQALHCHFQCH